MGVLEDFGDFFRDTSSKETASDRRRKEEECEKIYCGVLKLIQRFFLSDAESTLPRISSSSSFYALVLAFIVQFLNEGNFSVQQTDFKLKPECFLVKKEVINKLGFLSQKKLYNILVVDLLGNGKNSAYRKLYFIYNDDFSEVYTATAADDEIGNMLFGDSSKENFNITIYHKDMSVKATCTAAVGSEPNMKNYAVSGKQDLYAIGKTLLNLGSNYRDKIMI